MNEIPRRADQGRPGAGRPRLADNSIRPLIVDGHDPTRLGTALILQRERWVARCLLAPDAHRGALLASRHRPEVALLDVSGAGPFVASATTALIDAHPGIEVVLMSRCQLRLPDGPRAVGASALVPPSGGAKEIVAAVRAALLSPNRESQVVAPPAFELSEGERTLLLLISEGATNREIADRLHLGPDSVKKRASALYRKLGVRNRTEAAQRAAGLLGLRIS